MSLTAAASGFVVFFLAVQVIQGQNGWWVTFSSTEICAVKGSTVKIRCSYTYPSGRNNNIKVIKTFWFTKMDNGGYVDLKTDPEYSGRVEYSTHTKDCTLRITDLRQTDSAVYMFRFITNSNQYTGVGGVTLTVTDPELQVSRWYSNQLECHSSCLLPDNPSYIWYKNGEKIQAKTSSYSANSNSVDSYSCALQGYEDFPSPPVCVVGDSCNRVAYAERRICAFRGSSVDITCTYSSNNEYITSKFWFSPERRQQWQTPSQPEDLSEDSQYARHVQVIEGWRRSTLRISDLTDSDSAQYLFKFRTPNFEWGNSSPGTTLTVIAVQVQVISATFYQYYTWAELKCHSSCSPAAPLSYIWFKNGEKLQWQRESIYQGLVYPGDIISCALEGHEDHRSPSVYAPGVPSVSVSPAEIVEGSSVNLTCSSDANPPANYTWYKQDEVNLKPLSEEPQLVFSSIQSSDSGQYYCRAENKLRRTTSEYTFIDVKYPPKLPSMSVSPSAEIVEGKSVILTCSSDANPAAKYTWYKENQTLPQGPEGSYHFFASISSEDRGNYYCKSENQYGSINSSVQFIDVQYAPKRPLLSVSPSAEIVEGKSVNLTCSTDANPAANYTWYKENQTLTQGPDSIYRLTSLSLRDNGNYHCKSENQYGKMNSSSVLIDVQYPPKLLKVSVSPSLEVKEGILVNLTCSSHANPEASYTWYKEGEGSAKKSGQIFTIPNFRSEHSGNYYCVAQNTRGQQKSASYGIVVSESMIKSAAVGSVTAVVLAIIFLAVLLLIRRKRSSKQTTEPSQRPDNKAQFPFQENVDTVYDTPSAQPQRVTAKQQDDLYYASVRFTKNKYYTDALYSNIGLAQANRHEEEEDDEVEEVEYTMVNVQSAAESRPQEAAEDPSELYSTVSKKPRV